MAVIWCFPAMKMNLRLWLSCKEMVFVCVIWSFDDMGGTSLAGGVGSVAGAVMGAFIMASLDNGMSMMDVPTKSRNGRRPGSC